MLLPGILWTLIAYLCWNPVRDQDRPLTCWLEMFSGMPEGGASIERDPEKVDGLIGNSPLCDLGVTMVLSAPLAMAPKGFHTRGSAERQAEAAVIGEKTAEMQNNRLI